MLEIVKIGEYTIDFSRHELSKSGEAVIISKKISSARAWSFLEMLIRANGRILTYEFIDNSGIWPYDDYADHKSSYKAWASEFNKALGACKLIKNVSSVGYQLNPTIKVVASQNSSSEDIEHLNHSSDSDEETVIDEISQLNKQLDTLRINLDTILYRLCYLRNSARDAQLHDIEEYFDSMFQHFTYVNRIAEEKQQDLQRVKSSLGRQSTPICSCSRAGDSISFESQTDFKSIILAQNEILDTTNLLSRFYEEIDYIFERNIELLEKFIMNHTNRK